MVAAIDTAAAAPPASPNLPEAYRRGLSLCHGWLQWIALVAFLAAIVAVPLSIDSAFWLSLLGIAGVFALGTIGMNLLSGYAGQLSVGHAFFLSVGAYTAIGLGGMRGWPLLAWLPAAAVAGAVVGAVVGPLALRLRGPYLVVLSIGLVFTGIFIFKNWRSLSGGPGGTTVDVPLSIGPIDFSRIEIGNTVYRRDQSLAVLVWIAVAIGLLAIHNLTRSRSGRAMQAVRDDELAAELVGVSIVRAKVAAFALSGALGAAAGGLYAAVVQFVSPEAFDLTLSVLFVTMAVVGGLGATWGPIVGAVVVTLIPQLVDRYADAIPLVDAGAATSGVGFSVAEFTLLTYGALLVIFLIVEPRGLVALARRAHRRVADLGNRKRPIADQPPRGNR
jgi:branched-chain amino acid transport system permease protein